MSPVYYFPNTAARRGRGSSASNMHFETFGYAVAPQDNISFCERAIHSGRGSELRLRDQ
jgi:hypothetical protein